MVGTPTLGRDLQCWIVEQTDIDTAPGSKTVDPFLATDALLTLQANLTGGPEKIVIEDEKDCSNTIHEILDGRVAAEAALEWRARHPGAASTAPDDALLIKNAFGNASAGGSKYSFTPTTDPTAVLAILVADKNNENESKLMLGVSGDFIQESDGTQPIINKFEGTGKELIRTGRTTVPGGATAAATSITVADGSICMPGSLFAVGTRGGEMIQVGAVSGDVISSCVRGFGTSASAAIASGVALIPWRPSAATYAAGNTVVPSGNGSVTIGGETVVVRSWTVERRKNATVHNDSYGSTKADLVTAENKARTTFRFDGRKERALYDILIGGRHKNESLAIALDLGNTAGTDKYQWVVASAKMIDDGDDDTGREATSFSIELEPFHATANSEVEYKQV